MNILAYGKRIWKQDRSLQSVFRNTGYLFSSNTISFVLSALQGFLAAYLLGPADYGTLGLIILFASSVNRLLSFRMGEVVVKFAGQFLATGKRDTAAAIIKAAGLTEAVTSVIAYALLVLLAPVAAQWIMKDPLCTPWIIYYGLALLANLMTETSTAVLQVANHYRSQALLNLLQSILTAGWVLFAFFIHGGVYEVLSAYLAGKVLFGLGIMIFAFRQLKPALGDDWFHAPFSLIPDRRELAKFAVSTNLSGTINLVIRDSEVLWVGYFMSDLQAGYFKFALAVMNIILMPITPFITTTFPTITQSVAKKEWKSLSTLLRRTTLIAAAWTGICAVGLAVLGPWVFGVFKSGAYLPSLPLIFILLLGYGAANIFFWNRPLLLAFSKPNYPLKITFLVGAVKTALMFALVPLFGATAQAGLLTGYFIISVGLIVREGLALLRTASLEQPQE